MGEWSPGDDAGGSDTSSGSGSGDSSGNYPISEWSVADQYDLEDRLVNAELAIQNGSNGTSLHLDAASDASEELVEVGLSYGDYAYVDRAYGGAVCI